MRNSFSRYINHHLPIGGSARVAAWRARRQACSAPSAHDTHAQRASHAIHVTGEPEATHTNIYIYKRKSCLLHYL